MTEASDGPLPAVLRHLEACYPHEGCGVLLRAEATGAWRARPLANVHPRPATGYAFAPREWLAVLLEAEARGEHVAEVFHSHVDTGAYFSHEDARQAAPDGAPLLPGVCYRVVAVRAGRATEAVVLSWRAGGYSIQRRLALAENGSPLEIP